MRTTVVLGLIMLGAITLSAGDRGSAEEAKALLQKAAEHYKKVGRKQAMEDFTGKKSPWVDRDLYVACMDSKHVIIANGSFPNVVGMSADLSKDHRGNPLGTGSWDAAAQGGIQTEEWNWHNPVTGKMEHKIGFLE